mmetsp:Transcript_15179/g.37226  ORF Transcript_15179/g.37226 Transcript_15179/m.37226 type:complete len:202 (-) Transcript_15179:4298-4903(-)
MNTNTQVQISRIWPQCHFQLHNNLLHLLQTVSSELRCTHRVFFIGFRKPRHGNITITDSLNFEHIVSVGNLVERPVYGFEQCEHLLWFSSRGPGRKSSNVCKHNSCAREKIGNRCFANKIRLAFIVKRIKQVILSLLRFSIIAIQTIADGSWENVGNNLVLPHDAIQKLSLTSPNEEIVKEKDDAGESKNHNYNRHENDGP